MEETETGQLAALETRLQQLEDEISRETERLSGLRTEAEQQSLQVAQRPGDELAHAALSGSEEEIERIRKRLRLLDGERKQTRILMTTYLLQEQNARGQEIRDQIREWRVRYKELRGKLIPETELTLARLQEELQDLEDKIARASEDLRST